MTSISGSATNHERRGLTPVLEHILACPRCKQGLEWLDDGGRCGTCRHFYPFDHGKPNLLPPESQRALDTATATAENTQLRSWLAQHPWLAKLIDSIRPPLPYDRHGRWRGQRAFDEAIRRTSDSDPILLDLGAGEGHDEQLKGLSQETRDRLLRTDIFPGGRADFVADAHCIPIRDGSVDGVILQGVLEHVARPWDIAAEIVRVLKPGGVVFCEAPFVQWFHEDPSDYFRFTENGLREMFENCDVVESGVAVGPVGAAIGIGRELLPILFTSPYLYWPLKWVLAWLTAPLIVFDRLYRNRPRAKTIALGVYLVARKRGARI